MTAVCMRLVVAPPISNGMSRPWRSISAASRHIWSRLGVISPETPIRSAFSSRAVSRICVAGTMTPRSITSKLLQRSTTPTMFLPMSCTSPFTVAVTILPEGFGRPPARALLLLDEGHEMGDRLLHHAGALDHLRQEHLAGAEEVADHVHAVHQRPLDHVERAVGGAPRLLGVVDDLIGDAVHEREAEPAVDILLAPGVAFLLPLGAGACVAVTLGDFEQALGGVGPAVEQHILDRGPERLRQVLIDRELAGIDDTHVHAGPGRVIEERRVHRLAHGVVPAERERDVGDPTGDADVRPPGLDPARGFDEGAGVVVVLRDTGGDSEDVGVEDDIAGAEPDALGEQAIGALAYGELALRCFRLPLLVEGHDHHGRAVALHQPGLFQEGRLPLLEADGIDHRLARDRPQARLDGRPVGGIDHHGHARDIRLGRDEAEKAGHGGLAVQHSLVHVDVDDLGAVLDLLARDLQRSRVVARGDQLAEPGRAGDVGALAHIDEGAAIVPALEGLEPGKAEPGRVLRHCARRMSPRPRRRWRRCARAWCRSSRRPG